MCDFLSTNAFLPSLTPSLRTTLNLKSFAESLAAGARTECNLSFSGVKYALRWTFR